MRSLVSSDDVIPSKWAEEGLRVCDGLFDVPSKKSQATRLVLTFPEIAAPCMTDVRGLVSDRFRESGSLSVTPWIRSS